MPFPRGVVEHNIRGTRLDSEVVSVAMDDRNGRHEKHQVARPPGERSHRLGLAEEVSERGGQGTDSPLSFHTVVFERLRTRLALLQSRLAAPCPGG